jgi:hypothetical protein
LILSRVSFSTQALIVSLEGEPLLSPEGVGGTQLVAAFRVRRVAVDFPYQRAEGRLQLVFGQREVERLVHFGGGVAAGAGAGHGKSGGNAVRREEQVAVRAAQLRVQVECELIIVFGDDANVGLRRGVNFGGGIGAGQSGETQPGDKHTLHGRPSEKSNGRRTGRRGSGGVIMTIGTTGEFCELRAMA